MTTGATTGRGLMNRAQRNFRKLGAGLPTPPRKGIFLSRRRSGGKISGALRCPEPSFARAVPFLLRSATFLSRGGVRMQRFIRGLIGAVASVLGLGLCAIWVFAGEFAETGRGPVEISPSAKSTEAAIRKALDEKTVMEFVETPLQDAVEYLQKKHKINIQLDKKALDDAGLGTDTPITRSLKDISLRSALRLMLREFDLTWVIENEVLLLTTIDEAGQNLVTQVYDVVDLVVTDEGIDYDSLIETITTVVAPTTWDEVGGPGSISPLHRTLVVSQTGEVHEEIAELLTEVRRVLKARGDKATGNAAAETPPPDPKAVSVKVYRVSVPQVQKPGPSVIHSGNLGKREVADAKQPQNVADGNAAHTSNDRYLYELAQAIPSLVKPEAWERGGGGGVIYALPADSSGTGQLLVRQTWEIHRQLQSFLNSLQLKTGSAGGFGGGGGFF